MITIDLADVAFRPERWGITAHSTACYYIVAISLKNLNTSIPKHMLSAKLKIGYKKQNKIDVHRNQQSTTLNRFQNVLNTAFQSTKLVKNIRFM